MVRKRWIRLPTAWIPLLLPICAQPLSAQIGFKIIVHADNPTSSAPRSFVSRAFLKKLDKWDDGTRVAPVDLRPDSAIREAFSSVVHRRDLRGVLGFWQRQIFSGKDVPPLEVAGDTEAIAYVRSHIGGIGYVSEGARIEGVKVLAITDLSAEIGITRRHSLEDTPRRGESRLTHFAPVNTSPNTSLVRCLSRRSLLKPDLGERAKWRGTRPPGSFTLDRPWATRNQPAKTGRGGADA